MEKKDFVLTLIVALLVLVMGGVFLLFTQQTFLPTDTKFLVISQPDNVQRSYFFDDYELRVTSKNGYEAPTGCQPLGSSPCGGCSTLQPDSYGCARQVCSVPRSCEAKCREYRCSWTSYYRQWYGCGNFRCYSWNNYEVKASRWGDVSLYNCADCGTNSEESGGMQISNVRGCVSKFDLYYKGNNIYSFMGSLNDGFSRDTTHLTLRNGVVNPENGVTGVGNVLGFEEFPPELLQHDIDLYWGEKESTSSGDCVETGGVLTLTPPADAITTIVDDVPDFLFNGQYANVTILVRNSWRPVSGTIFVDYVVPTLVGNATKTESTSIILPVGNTYFSVVIPTTQVTDQVWIRPRFELSVDLSGWQGVLNFDRQSEPGIVTVGGQVVENWTVVQIVPKPLYIVKPNAGCQGDYTDSLSAPGYCVLNTLKELTCYQIGCPITNVGGENVSYECTSSGICAQTIFVENKCKIDQDCPTNTKCDVGSGLCIQEKVFENILQCQSTDDCAMPCTGKVASCSQNKCVYSGDCEVVTLPAEVIEKIVKLPPDVEIRQISVPVEMEKLKNNNTLVLEETNVWPYVIGAIVLLFVLGLVVLSLHGRKR